MFLQTANTYIMVEKEELVVKENVILVIDGKMKEIEVVDILQHSPLTVKLNKLFFNKQVRMVVVIINNVDLLMIKNVLN